MTLTMRLTALIFSELLECSDYEIGAPPFTVTAFHDGTDGLTLDWIEVRIGREINQSEIFLFRSGP